MVKLQQENIFQATFSLPLHYNNPAKITPREAGAGEQGQTPVSLFHTLYDTKREECVMGEGFAEES